MFSLVPRKYTESPTNLSYNLATHSLRRSRRDKSQRMKESIATVQEDEFGNLEKKYAKKTSSHTLKRQRMATTTTVNEDSNADNSDFSSSTSAPSTAESTDNASEVSNSEVFLTEPITPSLFSSFFLQVAAILPSKVPPTKNRSKKRKRTKKSKTSNAADASALTSTDAATPAPVTQSNSFTAAKVPKMVCDASHLIPSLSCQFNLGNT